MEQNKHPGAGKNGQPYNYGYYKQRFGIKQTEVTMALREIRYGTPQELEEYLKLKYQK